MRNSRTDQLAKLPKPDKNSKKELEERRISPRTRRRGRSGAVDSGDADKPSESQYQLVGNLQPDPWDANNLRSQDWDDLSERQKSGLAPFRQAMYVAGPALIAAKQTKGFEDQQKYKWRNKKCGKGRVKDFKECGYYNPCFDQKQKRCVDEIIHTERAAEKRINADNAGPREGWNVLQDFKKGDVVKVQRYNSKNNRWVEDNDGKRGVITRLPGKSNPTYGVMFTNGPPGSKRYKEQTMDVKRRQLIMVERPQPKQK